jgi:hypothetical protein
MKYTDSYWNACTHYVNQPEVISNSFAQSITIDVHNQLHQDLLKLEKKWITKHPFFCLGTTMIGINVTDTHLLANYQGVIGFKKSDGDPRMRNNSNLATTQNFSGTQVNMQLGLHPAFPLVIRINFK